MRINIAVLMLFFAVCSVVSAQTDQRITEIQKVYKETNEKVAECEADGEYSSTFLSEMTVNKNNGSYPAVGLFRTTYKFYYTYGDREKNPYPDRLLKIAVLTERSDQKENYEYLFDKTGQLIFYFEKKNDDAERRFYFALEKPIRILIGEQSLKITRRAATVAVKNIMTEKKKLLAIFNNSLE